MRNIFNNFAKFILLLMLISTTEAQFHPIDIKKINLTKTGDNFDLEIDYSLLLDSQLQSAMYGGVKIWFIAEMRFIEKRALWFDKDIKFFAWNASLSKSVSDSSIRYKLFGLDGEEQAVDLETALEEISLLTLQFKDSANLLDLICSDKGMFLHRVEVDLSKLPEPLQISMLTTADWDFSSGWKQFHKDQLGC